MSLKTNIKALLVDDELSAINNLSFLLGKYCPNIEIVATANNIDEAVLVLSKTEVDVVFLDIEMPEKSGFELFEETPQQFQTIFVTAYDEYAVKAFEVSAVDYLLKPIEVQRLQKAVTKLNNKQAQQLNINTLQHNLTKNIEQIIIPYKDIQLMIKLENIICFEANQSYCVIHCIEDGTYKNYIYSKSLKYFNDLLSTNPTFYRSHRSWLINLKKIISFSKRNYLIVLENDIRAQISKYKIKEFNKLI